MRIRGHITGKIGGQIEDVLNYFFTQRKFNGLITRHGCGHSGIGKKLEKYKMVKRGRIGQGSGLFLTHVPTLKRNKESDKWLEAKELDFKLAA